MESEPIGERPRSKTFISSKDWTLVNLLKRGEKFVEVPRVSVSLEDAKLHSIIRDYEQKGIPLVIDGLHNHPCWPEMFDLEWFRKNGQQDVKARNVHNGTDVDIPLSELIKKQRAIATTVTSNKTERLYGKDAHCPEAWSRWLNESGVIPYFLAPGSPSNLLEVLPEKERVETLMCYLGIGDTFTPCHKDLCASSGQNVMCYTENSGSSFWFMTESSSAPAVTEYFHKLGQELDLETHVITIEELAEGPFKVYVVEQRLGDMVLVPPRSCHQVVNHGGITIKTSWSRMTLAGLTTALYHELPLYRRVCRSETYRVKETIYQTLLHYTKSTPINAADLRCLINLFDDVLLDEYYKDHKKMSHVLQITAASDSSPDHSDALQLQDNTRVTCDFCDTDIFQSFFECKRCIPDEEDPARGGPSDEVDGLIICPQCYIEGRTCRCGVMTPMQYRAFSQLLLDRNNAVCVLVNSGSGRESDTVLDERDLESELEFSVFRSACVVHKYRKKLQERRGSRPKTTSRCRHGHGYQIHLLPCAFVLHCKLCHAGKCFSCILGLGIHSAEAVSLYHTDPTHQTWHNQHKRKERLEDIRRQDLEAEMIGGRCDRRKKLIAVAANFNTCVPSKQDFINPGWYDKFIQISSALIEEGEKQTIEKPSDYTDGMTNTEPSDAPMMSEISFLPSDEENLGAEMHTSVIPDSLNIFPRIVRKRNREVLDCVLIPLLESATSGPTEDGIEVSARHRHRHNNPFGASRAVRFSPESTSNDTMVPLPPDSYGVDEQPAKKKVRSSRGPPGLRDVEFKAGSSASVIREAPASIPSTKADLVPAISSPFHSAGPLDRNYNHTSTPAGRLLNMDQTRPTTRSPRPPRSLNTTVRELVQGLQDRIDDLEAENLKQSRHHRELSQQFLDLQQELQICKSQIDGQNAFNFEQRLEEGAKNLVDLTEKKFSEVKFEMAAIRSWVQKNLQTDVSSHPGPPIELQPQVSTQPHIQDLNAVNGARSQRSLAAFDLYTQNRTRRENHENSLSSKTGLLSPREPTIHPHRRNEREVDHGRSLLGFSSAPSQDGSPQRKSQTENDYSDSPTRRRQELPRGPHVSTVLNSNGLPPLQAKQSHWQNLLENRTETRP